MRCCRSSRLWTSRHAHSVGIADMCCIHCIYIYKSIEPQTQGSKQCRHDTLQRSDTRRSMPFESYVPCYVYMSAQDAARSSHQSDPASVISPALPNQTRTRLSHSCAVRLIEYMRNRRYHRHLCPRQWHIDHCVHKLATSTPASDEPQRSALSCEYRTSCTLRPFLVSCLLQLTPERAADLCFG
jgi:hypothetical protein